MSWPATAATSPPSPRSVHVTGATPAALRPDDPHRLRPARHGLGRSVAPINDASHHVPMDRTRSGRAMFATAMFATALSFVARMTAGGLR